MGLFRKKKGKASAEDLSLEEEQDLLCDKLGFAAAEAYKLLRTNITFAIPDEGKCRIIGVTSADRGEGKSTTSVNLAYTLAETGKKVLLIDSDMRIPTVAKRFKLHNAPGLSNFLAGQVDVAAAIQDSGYFKNWKILTAGDIPPNPSELLGSDRMKTRIEYFAKSFDYIILDLPPINIVADALAVARLVDGIIMVSRQDYSNKKSVADALSIFRMANVNILGFVLTRAGSKSSRYKKYGKYGKYGYSSYGSGYGYGYGYGSKKKSTEEDLPDRKEE